MTPTKSPSTVLMIRPKHFGFNPETAASNAFQQRDTHDPAAVKQQALAEFDHMVDQLRAEGVNVMVVEDRESPVVPDAVFPNNWFSTHPDGTLVFYPMEAPIRRLERRTDILKDLLDKEGFDIRILRDYTQFEDHQQYLEGTGSILFDHPNKKAYASLSSRTDERLLLLLSCEMGYDVVRFHAFDAQGKAIYHTNVIMCLAPRYAIICQECITESRQWQLLSTALQEDGKEIIPITFAQVKHFAGNMLSLQGSQQELVVMSAQARASLNPAQVQVIERFAKIVAIPVPTIEKYGGGSVRCMMAEISLPKLGAYSNIR
ncbi:arginine deiminase-related protein [Cytophagales bacterium LB-30]|uniref:Arginine deiminase-related protein n=1 Tax=Shiella aurantiaca TaxID=3058365 RepID=A0ABT8F7I7_9BACT|nr:arginine deiminase-related protein [Shiella aurantiaca]MDN4166453.1 arginine deiminase-related protein [Shiella aurantiaca]